jgi:bifunctional enzyme CysN/CysC
LKAEREQAITIDVAYRYFYTSKRKFVIADTPGHEQYTRNMVTAASTADLALILVDARKGILEQTRRHTYIAWLLGIRDMIVSVNKMDLLDFDPDKFYAVCQQFEQFAAGMRGLRRYFVPISALRGDNVVRIGRASPWYRGPALLNLLETISVEKENAASALRFPVQYIIRPNQDFRGYAGQIVSGSAKPGAEVVVLPSLYKTRIAQVRLHEKQLAEASAPQSVVFCLADHVDLCRGDMLVDATDLPLISHQVVANLIWLSHSPLRTGTPYLIRHTTQILCGSVLRVVSKIEMNSLEERHSPTLQLNDIGRVELETHKPMFCEPYHRNRALGSFIMIDPTTNSTVAGGIILEATSPRSLDQVPGLSSSGAQPHGKGLTVWFTGLSGAGKTTLCNALHTELLVRGIRSEVMDGDVVRKHLNSDLGFNRKDREENVRRISFVANLLTRNGVVVLVAAISPYREIRSEARNAIRNFREVYVNAPLDVCERRDPKGLYKKARAGELPGFTGIDDIYEPPDSAEIRCDTHLESVRACVDKVLAAILEYLSSEQ